MQKFFMLSRISEQDQCAVMVLTYGEIMVLVEKELSTKTRARCEMADTHVGRVHDAAHALRRKWKDVEFFTYTPEGAQRFMREADRYGNRTALKAIAHVEALRDSLSVAIDKELDTIRSRMIQMLTQAENWTTDADFVKDTAKIIAAGSHELLNLI